MFTGAPFLKPHLVDDVESTMVTFSSLSPYTHKRYVYRITAYSDQCFSRNALSVMHRLQYIVGLSDASKPYIRPLNNPSDFIEWYHSVLVAFAAKDPIFWAYCILPMAEFRKVFDGEERDIDCAVCHIICLFTQYLKQFIGVNCGNWLLSGTLSREHMEKVVKPHFEEMAEPLLVMRRENDLFVQATNGELVGLINFMQAHGFDEYTIWSKVSTAMVTVIQGEKKLSEFSNEWSQVKSFPTDMQDTVEVFVSHVVKLGLLPKKFDNWSGIPKASKKSKGKKHNGKKSGKAGKSGSAGAAKS